MDAVSQNAKTPEQLAHEKIQDYREKIKQLRQDKCVCLLVSEEDSSDNLLFTWDELSHEENVTKIKGYYAECILQAETFHSDLDVLYEYANLLRYNKEYLAAFHLFQKVEGYYLQKETPASDYFALYTRMQICCEKTYGEAFALPYVRKVWEFGLKQENEDADENLTVISLSLFHTVDLDWQRGGLGDDLALLQHTLESLKRADERHLPAYRELKAIVTGYIAVCKVFRNEDKNLRNTLTALDLFQTILGEKSDFKWTLEASACCGRLSGILKAHGDKEIALMAAKLQYEILKQAADRQLAQYGPECFCVCDNLIAVWTKDDPKYALEFCRRAMDIRLRLATAGVKTFMQQRTVQSFAPAVLPPLRESYQKLISAQINSCCCTLEEIAAEDEKYEQAIEYAEGLDNDEGHKDDGSLI